MSPRGKRPLKRAPGFNLDRIRREIIQTATPNSLVTLMPQFLKRVWEGSDELTALDKLLLRHICQRLRDKAASSTHKDEPFSQQFLAEQISQVHACTSSWSAWTQAHDHDRRTTYNKIRKRCMALHEKLLEDIG